MATNEQSRVRDTFLRTIAVVGLVAVLLLGAWGIIQLAVALPSLFGSIGGGASNLVSTTSKESVSLSAPTTIASGQSLTISWNHQNGNGDYSYALSYACQNGVSLKAPLPTGSYQTVPCNTPFNFVNATNKMTLVPTLTGSQSATLALTVAATQLSTGAITTQGSANVNVTSGQTSTASNTSTGASSGSTQTASSGATSTYYPAATRPALYGYSDLATTILSVTPNGSLTNVQFQIQNVGTNVVAGGWTFNANLPINGGYTFASQSQQTLYPGDKIIYTLSFSGANNYPSNYYYGYSGYGNGGEYYPGQYTTGGSYTCNQFGPCDIPGYATSYGKGYSNSGYSYQGGAITITADPYNHVPEITKSNNTATVGGSTAPIVW